MSQSNINREKSSRRDRLPYSEAMERIPREKANKQQRRKTRFDWSE